MVPPPALDLPPAAPVTPRAFIGVGTVRHERLRPRPHRFQYPTWFVLLPMRHWRATGDVALARNHRKLVSFWDRDHGEGGDDSLHWIESLLAREGIRDADGEIWLHTYPRVLGYAFKPVSFWYCERADGTLAAIVVEVNSTFGERHCYLLAGPDLAWGRELHARKVFHVSPFCALEGSYRFRFLRSAGDAGRPPRTVVRIEHDGADGPLLKTSVSGTLEPLTPRSLLRACARMPLLTFGILVRIHWQALRLWLGHAPFHRKPAPPESFVSR